MRAAPGSEGAVGDPGLGLYVHWPWCLSKCPYCDFNSHVVSFGSSLPEPEGPPPRGADAVGSAASRSEGGRRSPPDPDVWARAYIRDLETQSAILPHRRPLASVFFGGGTPSLMDPATVDAVLTTAARLFSLTPDLEVTLEANPGAVDQAGFAGFRAAGVTRLSLGVQALDDAALAFLGRRHDRCDALRALDLAQATFPRVSLDLIYARPGQTPDAWRRELGEALALGTEHLSLYQLTIERGTAFFGRHRAGLLSLPDEDTREDWGADLFEVTQDLTASAGVPAYEVSNHARPGAECRHNRDIWRGGDYLGIGPGAHGRLADRATRCVAHPRAWLERVDRTGHGMAGRDDLSPRDRAVERVLMGLRLTEGLDAARFARLSGMALVEVVDGDALADLADLGLVTWDGRRLATTGTGRLCLNTVTGRLLR